MASAHAETAWPQSAAAPSPFPPLAQYAHLGNFSQAFSHFAPRETAARVILAERLEEPA